MQNWSKKEKGLKRIALLYICAGPSQVEAAPELHLGGPVQILMQQSIRAAEQCDLCSCQAGFTSTSELRASSTLAMPSEHLN